MKKLFKLLLLLVVVTAVAGIIASIVSKKKFANMTDEEIRAFLASKLDGKVQPDQLTSIQDAVIAGVRSGGQASDGVYLEDVSAKVSERLDTATDAVEAAIDDAADAADEAEEASDAVTEEIEEAFG